MRKRYPPCEKKTFSVREELFHDPRQQPNRGNLTYHAPPCGGGVGGGAAIFCPSTNTQHPTFNTYFYKECQLFPLSKYYPYLCLRMLTET